MMGSYALGLRSHSLPKEGYLEMADQHFLSRKYLITTNAIDFLLLLLYISLFDPITILYQK
jgi:hypothetical protein